ncbi:hypothetical protein EJ08DRAFT_609735 [Tothia fuscella]|uniref:C3H1-type domain-containing protein n=1 Tax=Tothia fuscella TaxID=1048955 RepID=A0A9P4TZV4_9PEZI|nr:hypothetical protein EJ08DRAFT_609735 [Tothia fuscella]
MTDYAYLEAQLHGFKESDRQRDALLMETLQRLVSMESKYKATYRDYESERTFRHHWQDKAESAERDLLTIQTNVEANSFIQVLIDGDAAYFHDALIQAGADGASQAAHKLLVEIKNHLASRGIDSDLPVFVNIYANVGGLAGKLTYLGLIDGPGDMHNFVRAFNTSQPLFNFVDVGSGKEKADHKIREMFRIQLSNKQCKHIIFGGCHDNGYLTILEQYRHDNDTSSRISLLETIPAQAGFYALNIKMSRFPSVFRAESLDKSLVIAMPQLRQTASATNIRSPNTNTKSNTPPVPSNDASPVPGKAVAVNTTVPKASPSASKASSVTSWASAAVANGVPSDKEVTLANRTKKTKPTVSRFILYNYDGNRLDATLPPASANDHTNLHARMEKAKLCNDHFLRGMCVTESCKYSHSGKLSAGELNALRHKARKLSCPNKLGCEDYDCYCGHVCPYEKSGKCKGEGCHFEDVHGIDRVGFSDYFFWV